MKRISELLIITSFILLTGIVLSCTGMNPDPADEDDTSVYIPPGWIDPELWYEPEEYFPAEVVVDDCIQAPGQYANSSAYGISGNTDKLLGAPSGGGSETADNSSIVSLGKAGGCVTVKFEPPIENHDDNIGGFDFIVFGNAYWYAGSTSSGWREPAVIWVKQDMDGDGVQDDDEPWYLIPGSHLDSGDSPHDITYSEADYTGTNYETWWPDGASSPLTFTGQFILPGGLYDSSGNGELPSGYADVTPTLQLGDMSGADGEGDNELDDTEDYPDIDPVYFYTVPDTPGDNKIDAGSGGGDAVDIADAVDPATFAEAGLTEVTWIKIVSGTDEISDAVGEYSAEIDAVARVRRTQ